MYSIAISIRNEDEKKTENYDSFSDLASTETSASFASSTNFKTSPGSETSTLTSSKSPAASNIALTFRTVAILASELQRDDLSTSSATDDNSPSLYPEPNNSVITSFFTRHQNIVIAISSILSSIIILLICILILSILRYRNYQSRRSIFCRTTDRNNGSWCRRNSDTQEKQRPSLLNDRARSSFAQLSIDNTNFQSSIGTTTEMQKPNYAILSPMSYSPTGLLSDDASGAGSYLPKYSRGHLWRQHSISQTNGIQQSKELHHVNSRSLQSSRILSDEPLNERIYPSLSNVDEETMSEFGRLRTGCSSPDASIFDGTSTIGSVIGGLAPRPVTRS